MKAIAFTLIILLLGTIAYFQFRKYQRFHPPIAYEYKLNEDIDYKYHNPSMVDDYISQAFEVGAFARQMWFNHKVDVRFPNQNKAMAVWAADKYKSMVSNTKKMEGILIQSKNWKEKGYSNVDIRSMEASGADPKALSAQKAETDRKQFLMDYLGESMLRRGRIGQDVMELQKLLNANGFETKVDGNFRSDTETALKTFQTSQNLYASGVLDPVTLRHLLD